MEISATNLQAWLSPGAFEEGYHVQTDAANQSCAFAFKIVSIDYVLMSPIPGLDPLATKHTDIPIPRVPVIRIFGPSAFGQQACIYVHGFFPYFYIPLPVAEFPK
ncbi:hypothetical protein IE077_003578, partial [Cardiosporidium cionae]